MHDHWDKHAQQWQWIGSPLRPAPEDIQALERAVLRWHTANPLPSLQALLLGVTPEITLMCWPPGTRLIAVDHSEAMISEVWVGGARGHNALCAEWSDSPLPPGSHDIIVGDGSMNMLVGRVEWDATVRAMRRVVREQGLFLMRFFVRPVVAESAAGVVDDLMQGRIGNFHVFKWRLAMALHGGLDDGVRLSDIWDAWHGAVPNPEQLASRLNWPLRAVHTIEAYRGVQTRYNFPTLAEARAMMAVAFEEIDCAFPGYELGERCPTLAFRPRQQ